MDTQTPLQPINVDQPMKADSEPAIPSALNEPSEKKPSHKKLYASIIAALVLVAAVGVAVAVINRNAVTSPQPVVVEDPVQETVSNPPVESPQKWEDYTNLKYKFMIRYYNDWIVTESPSGNGATFKPQSSTNTPGITDEITASVSPKVMTETEMSFEEYVKVAAKQEIQNYNELATIEKITTSGGFVGYKTTWMIQSITNDGAAESESPAITYFQLPGDSTHLLRVSSGYDVDEKVYDDMINSVTFVLIDTWPMNEQPISAPGTTPTAVPAANDEAALKATIKQQILADSDSDGSSLTVSVSTISGDYAKGMASEDGGGGLWFAAKVNGAWKLVWDGNGMIMCTDLAEYPDFPSSIIPECYDQAADKMVKR